MYKVFIDNKVIIFTENLKKSNEIKDFILVHVASPEVFNLVKLRNELPMNIALIVQCNDPEAAIMTVFRGYELVQAAGGIVKRKKKILFIERFGLWDLPKGKMETGEVPELTAVREVEEEVGIKGPQIESLIGITYHTYDHKGVPTLKKNWWYALSYNGPKDLVPQSEEGITRAEWLPEKDWHLVRNNTYASINEVLKMYEEL